MKATNIPKREIGRALRDILASPNFVNSPKLSSLLRYLVEQPQSADPNKFKAYTIAVEALGKSEDFDPQLDPVVRVLVGRLRKALDSYYLKFGAHASVTIYIPVGSYKPLMTKRTIDKPPSLKTIYGTTLFFSSILRKAKSWITLVVPGASRNTHDGSNGDNNGHNQTEPATSINTRLLVRPIRAPNQPPKRARIATNLDNVLLAKLSYHPTIKTIVIPQSMREFQKLAIVDCPKSSPTHVFFGEVSEDKNGPILNTRLVEFPSMILLSNNQEALQSTTDDMELVEKIIHHLDAHLA